MLCGWTSTADPIHPTEHRHPQVGEVSFGIGFGVAASHLMCCGSFVLGCLSLHTRICWLRAAPPKPVLSSFSIGKKLARLRRLCTDKAAAAVAGERATKLPAVPQAHTSALEFPALQLLAKHTRYYPPQPRENPQDEIFLKIDLWAFRAPRVCLFVSRRPGGMRRRFRRLLWVNDEA